MPAETTTLIGRSFTTPAGEKVSIFTDPQGVIREIRNGQALQPLLAEVVSPDLQRLAPESTPQTAIPGVILRRDTKGVLHPVASDKTQLDMQFFLPDTPAWFDGCKELRDAYAEEKAALDADPDCPDCQKGALMRKYLLKLSKLDTTPTLGL